MSGKSNETVWRLLKVLRSIPVLPRRITTKEICAALENDNIDVSRRTIERDMQELSARFPLIVDESARPFGWSWAKHADFDVTPRMSPPQGIALLLAQAHLRTLLPQQMQNALLPLFDMARRELSHGVWKDWHRRTAVVPSALTLFAPDIDNGVLADVQDALAKGRQLSATYRSKGAREGRKALLHPLGLIIRGQLHYLACTFEGYQDVRQLALHRLSGTSVEAACSIAPCDFDFQQYAKQSGRYEAEGLVRLVANFSSSAAEHLRETHLSADQQIIELGGGDNVQLRATITLDQPLRWWLRGFGSQVVVIEPAALRSEFQAEAAAALAAYRSTDALGSHCESIHEPA